MKLDLKAIEERCEKAEQDTMHTMRLLAFHQKDIPALLAFAKEAKEVLAIYSKYGDASKVAREVLAKWFGEGK